MAAAWATGAAGAVVAGAPGGCCVAGGGRGAAEAVIAPWDDAMEPGESDTRLLGPAKDELGFEHQAAIMPDVPPPEQLLNMEEIRERRLTDPRFPMQYRNSAAKKKFVPWPIEMRFCGDSASQHKPSLNYWFRARGKLSDDPALHRCVVAYASDLLFSGVSLNPHREKGLKTYSLSLDHSMWFHKPVKADDWLLYVIESPSAHGGRGFVTARMFNRQGELVMSLTQEALIRRAKTPGQTPRPKL
ncbi:hypothetical protein GUJ93_ZPchr0004g40517 [Zizania palustris]|uniref:Acyl-CoA thioesterase-like C-terminal domain-containing protein n=1 Tax=Zizania palustris TaxID=103762 RepID=A0A8J5VG25_ZIZPA|nr:hypothetical protein GUJ93_ZPchr0004g40517 [Zizania palustris]